ncbi:hypothetical protein AB0F91_10890 [Amycolatopsis sp. NPDC023774]
MWPDDAVDAPFPLDYPTLSPVQEDDTKFTELRIRTATSLGAERA